MAALLATSRFSSLSLAKSAAVDTATHAKSRLFKVSWCKEIDLIDHFSDTSGRRGNKDAENGTEIVETTAVIKQQKYMGPILYIPYSGYTL